MKTSKLICTLVLGTLLNSYAEEGTYRFNHFELTPDFQADLEAQQRIKQRVVVTEKALSEEDTPLYEELIKEIFPHYQQIGYQQTDDILKYNQQFDLGEKNFSGFNWQLPKGSFSVSASRQVAPDIHKEGQWIVEDKLTLSIEATTYLDNLKKENRIQISDAQMALFAGVAFQRVYTYYHFAESYVKGLTSDFSKLFLSFMLFRYNKGILRLEPYEIVNKEDFLTLKAVGAVNVPPNPYHITGKGGVIVEAKRVAQMSAQRLGPNGDSLEGEFLRFSFNKERSLNVGVTGSVSTDFLQLLKLTLLTADFTYDLKNEQKISLHFFEKDREALSRNTGIGAELQKLLLFQNADLSRFEEYQLAENIETTSGLNLQYKTMLMGGVKKGDTEYISIQQDGEKHIFFKSYARSLFYIKSLFEQVFNVVAEKLSKYAFDVNSLATWDRLLEIEYESSLKDSMSERFMITRDEKASVRFTQEYQTKETRGWLRRIFKSYALDFIQNYTNLDPQISKALQEDKIYGPLLIRSHIYLDQSGLDYFNRLTYDETLDRIYEVCDQWSWGKMQLCYQLNKMKYQLYRKEWNKKSEMSLWLLKDFLRTFQRFAQGVKDYELIFGKESLFVQGVFTTNSGQKKVFNTYFTKGPFKGLGVIDGFLRDNKLPLPTSIPY